MRSVRVRPSLPWLPAVRRRVSEPRTRFCSFAFTSLHRKQGEGPGAAMTSSACPHSCGRGGSSFSQRMMEFVLVCLTLLCFTSFRSERSVAALPAATVQVRAGEDATLQCPLLDTTFSGAPSTISWYRKVSGGAPQLLLSLRSTNISRLKFGSGVAANKVSVTADGSLLLRGSERSDAAVYYCGVSQGDEQKEMNRTE